MQRPPSISNTEPVVNLASFEDKNAAILATSDCVRAFISFLCFFLRVLITYRVAQPAHRYRFDERRSSFRRIFDPAHDFRQPECRNWNQS